MTAITAHAASASSGPIRLIQEALKGDVIDVLRREMPILADLGRDAAYEMVMNEPNLADAGFRLFRSRPELFSTVVIDQSNRPVTADNHPLRCGRTLADAMSLIVQAVAKRYFRRKLGGPRDVPVGPQPKKTLLHSIGLARAPAPQLKRVPGPGDILFNAFRPLLRFDWQAQLIPHYAPLSPNAIAKLGESLLRVREPAELRALAGRDAEVISGRAPLLLDGAKRLFEETPDIIDSEVLWKVANQMDLGRLIDGGDRAALRRAIAQIARTRREMVDCLMPTLGSDIRMFVTFLFVAYAEMGEEEYRRTFATTGSTRWVLDKFAEALVKSLPLPPPTLDEMRRHFAKVIKG